MRRGRAREIADEVRAAVLAWPRFAAEAGVPERVAAAIGADQRLDATT
jgi:hypothetical protein